MANERIYYPMQCFAIREASAATWNEAQNVVRGAQSVGTNTSFNLVDLFQIGQQETYENIEELPDIEVTASKVLDGSPLMFHLATQQSAGNNQTPDLVNRGPVKCDFGLSIFAEETNGAADGQTPGSSVVCSGMYFSNVAYSFPLEDNFSEQITLVGNDKVWYETSSDGPTGVFNASDQPVGLGGVNRRENLIFEFATGVGLDCNNQVADPDATILPTDIFGITSSGTNEEASDQYRSHVANINVSANISRPNLNEQGRFAPYTRTIEYPVEVTTDIEVTTTSGDRVNAVSNLSNGCSASSNLTNQSIRIVTCEGTHIYTGCKNKLQSVSYGGADAGGGNATVTYSYRATNTFTVMHPEDPNASGGGPTGDNWQDPADLGNTGEWWYNRGDYLVDL